MNPATVSAFEDLVEIAEGCRSQRQRSAPNHRIQFTHPADPPRSFTRVSAVDGEEAAKRELTDRRFTSGPGDPVHLTDVRGTLWKKGIGRQRCFDIRDSRRNIRRYPDRQLLLSSRCLTSRFRIVIRSLSCARFRCYAELRFF